MRAILALYVVSVVYAMIRYVAFAPKNLENLPVFIVNKGISMAAAICFAIGFFCQLRQLRGAANAGDPSAWFRAGVFGAVMHIPMSLAILRPAYFKEFFKGDRLSFAGEMVFFFGGLTAACIFLLLRTGWTAMARWWLSLACMTALLVHVCAMGYCRGLNINKTHAYMPPMWALSAVAVTIGIGWLLWSRPRDSAPKTGGM